MRNANAKRGLEVQDEDTAGKQESRIRLHKMPSQVKRTKKMENAYNVEWAAKGFRPVQVGGSSSSAAGQNPRRRRKKPERREKEVERR